MVEKFHVDITVKGDLSDTKNYEHASIKSEKDIQFMRFRSKKKGDSWSSFSRKMMRIIGMVFSPKVSAINMYRTYLLRNGERGCSKKDVIDYLEDMKFTPEQIDEVIKEVEENTKE